MNVYSEIPQILSSLNIPVVAIVYPDIKSLPNEYIVVTKVDAPNKTATDGNVTGVSIRVQVTYYTRDGIRLEDISSQIENLVIAAGFMRIGPGSDSYFQETRHYSHRQDFRYYERR